MDLDLIIIVCSTDQTVLQRIERTYGKNLPKKIVYFSDERGASYTQWTALKHVRENYPTAKYVMYVGGDAYVNIPKLSHCLGAFSCDVPSYIGGHGDVRKIEGLDVYFHSGGPGFVLTRAGLELLYPRICDVDAFMVWWTQICGKDLVNAPDVCMGYLSLELHLRRITLSGFQNCNYMGYCYNMSFGCHVNRPFNRIISCNNMSSEDFDRWTQILSDNNYFLQ